MDEVPNNPLHLLDDYLASLPPIKPSADALEAETDDSPLNDPHEIHHDLTLRIAADLFGNNPILENALSLLEEQEQFQREAQGDKSPIIRTVRAKRSCRQIILIRKQRSTKRRSSPNESQSDNGFYLCLLGKERTDAINQVHRRGMHCTCRSFLQNVKGAGRKSGGSGDGVKASQSIICKHLLAVILMPHLLPWRKGDVEVDVLEDREFAKLVASAPCHI